MRIKLIKIVPLEKIREICPDPDITDDMLKEIDIVFPKMNPGVIYD